MKKWVSLFLCFAALFTLAGCGDNASSGRMGKQPTGVNDVLETEMADEDSAGSQASSRLPHCH